MQTMSSLTSSYWDPKWIVFSFKALKVCSFVFPLISGTRNRQKKKAMAMNAEKTQKIPSLPNAYCIMK